MPGSRTIVLDGHHLTAEQVELIAASQALDLRLQAEPDEPLGLRASFAVRTIRKIVPSATKDRMISRDIQSVEEIIHNGELLDAVDSSLR